MSKKHKDKKHKDKKEKKGKKAKKQSGAQKEKLARCTGCKKHCPINALSCGKGRKLMRRA